jgi:uncharacterized protein YabN with tetrapyrrole methylase and pyrophosphatase domain
MHSKTESGKDVNPFQQLDKIVRKLRSPEGCPWDQRQTGKSLKKYLLEEANELAEAIDTGDEEHIREEIGDMYFILTMLSLIYEEKDGVSSTDAVQQICRKMVRRHPHVFEKREGQLLSEQALREQWERIKQEEKQQGRKK